MVFGLNSSKCGGGKGINDGSLMPSGDEYRTMFIVSDALLDADVGVFEGVLEPILLLRRICINFFSRVIVDWIVARLTTNTSTMHTANKPLVLIISLELNHEENAEYRVVRCWMVVIGFIYWPLMHCHQLGNTCRQAIYNFKVYWGEQKGKVCKLAHFCLFALKLESVISRKWRAHQTGVNFVSTNHYHHKPSFHSGSIDSTSLASAECLHLTCPLWEHSSFGIGWPLT